MNDELKDRDGYTLRAGDVISANGTRYMIWDIYDDFYSRPHVSFAPVGGDKPTHVQREVFCSAFCRIARKVATTNEDEAKQ